MTFHGDADIELREGCQTMKYRVVPFVCANTGRKFFVVFQQYSSAHQFQVLKIVLSESRARDFLRSGQTQKSIIRPGDSRKSDIEQSSSKYQQPKITISNGKINKGELSQFDLTTSYNAEDFDISGWFCPHCGHAKGDHDVPDLFIQCGECGQLVCGGRVTTIDDTRLFACHDKCGRTSAIQGEITSYAGKETDIERGKLLPGNS